MQVFRLIYNLFRLKIDKDKAILELNFNAKTWVNKGNFYLFSN